jgi:hypothetical protein
VVDVPAAHAAHARKLLKDDCKIHKKSVNLALREGLVCRSNIIGIVMLISIISASLIGFGLAYFEYQPQMENMRTELFQLNSNIIGLQ